VIPTSEKTRVGIYDGDLAVWDDGQAYVLTNGVWREAEAFVLWHEAAVNIAPAYIAELLRNAPPLPSGAVRQEQ
jgi:hypothetical protein